MEIGKAKYTTGKHVHKIEDGDNVFRILPPLGKLAKKGFWNQYYRVEWGYKNSAGKNRPFQDVRVVNYDTKMVEVESAAHLRREALKAAKAEVVAELKKNPTNTALKQKSSELTDAIKRFNLDSKYYLNAIDLQGKIGLLKIGSRAFKALKVEIDKLRKQGIDPLSMDNGRFFNISRSNATGNFQDTAYQVTVYEELVEVNGEAYKKAKPHKIDQSIIDRLADEAFELSGMYPEVTAEQVEQMVAEGAPAVDRILGAGDSRAESEDDEVAPETVTSAVAASTTTANSISDSKVTATTTPPKEEVKKVEAVKTATPAAPATTTTKSQMSDDEFLKSIGAVR